MGFVYFAYGSNMLNERLKARCPSAMPLGRAKAQGYRLEFTKKSVDGSGKATLVATDDGALIPGMIYEISDEDLVNLDNAEGAGSGYKRFDDFVVETDGGLKTATTYLANEPQQGLIPYDWYLALVVAGTQENSLGKDHVDLVRSQKCKPDAMEDRKTRLEAIRALEYHGYSDFQALLSR